MLPAREAQPAGGAWFPRDLWAASDSWSQENALLPPQQCPKDPNHHGWMHLYGCPYCDYEIRVCLICQIGFVPSVPPHTYVFPFLGPHFCTKPFPPSPVPVTLVLKEQA